MRIQKLKIFGFKSFAQKVEIQFEGNGLTAIVGPNGCGKSNIVDAIRWVMGEQRAGQLRMDKIQGVIFSGTEERPAMSMAEVSLVIENDRGLLPSEYSEVVITRRLFNNGESEYLINNQACRLADIRNIFADTGMGANSYSQMDQRMVDALLSDKADERRSIFEEAAGVGKYKKQRKEAASQLEKVQIDMDRIAVDLQYAKNQFRQQERMLTRAQELRKLKNRLKEIDVSINIGKYAESKASLHTLSATKTKSGTELETLKTRLTELETKIEEKRLLITSEEEDWRESEREVSLVSTEVAKLNEAYIYQQNRNKELEENAEHCEREISESESGISALKEELQSLESESILQDTRERVEQLRASHRELSNKRLLFVQEESKLKGAWQRTDAEIEMLGERISQASKEIQNLNSQIEELESLKKSKESKLGESKGESEILQERQSVLANEKADLGEALESLTNQKIESMSRVNRLQSCTENCEFIDYLNSATSDKLNILKVSLEEERKKADLINSQITAAKERSKEIDILIANAAEEKQQADSQVRTAISELEIAKVKSNALAEQKERLEQSVSVFENRLQELKSSKDSNAELSAAASELNRVEQDFERIDTELGEQERLLSSLIEKENRLRIIKEKIQNFNSVLVLRSEELEAINSKKESLEKELEEKAIQIERQQELLSAKEKLRDAAREKYSVMSGDLEEWRSEVRGINHSLRDKERSMHELELAIQASGTSLERVRERIFQEYEFDLEKEPGEQAFTPISTDERDAGFEMRDLQEKIKTIGPVNATVAEDFEAERERVLAIEAQFNDLAKAKTSLSTAIERLDIVARDRFLDTFRKIQRNYQEVFASLMPGGEALLAMQSDLDPLEAEIEINARPTGKKMRGVRALSGGERALTATSLLFALYMVKPSPYCILDEIDGPLDDANIGRFLALLRRFSHQTQFVVITHNKRTMAGCDMLYGISQEMKGISKVGSVRLEEISEN
ncbi:MAG: AAA family ATPase [Fibromonadaceae bacterium]|nr:AAA family ATPase [Fibromonadaceae bacterium]